MDAGVILSAYHRKIARHRQSAGVSYPIVRENCIRTHGCITTRGSIYATDVFDPQKVAEWRVIGSGRIAIDLV